MHSPGRAVPPVLALLICATMDAAEPGTQVTDSWDHVPPRAESLFHLGERPLSNTGWALRTSGHARTMFEAVRNPDFGFSGLPDDAWIHHRIQALAALHHGQNFSLASELTWGEMQGRATAPGPVDEDRPDFLQLYAQGRLELATDHELALRLGRQLLVYGSGRLLSHREGANQRLAHDAARLGWRHEGWQVDGFIASPVRISPEAFDNQSQPGRTRLWGLYATGPSPFGEGHGVDLYYLGLRQENAPLSPGATELRHTWGTRWFGRSERWRYNHEFILQTGESGGREILAGAISLGAGREFSSAPLKPVLGFKADLISGGQSASSVHTFNPLFQANNYFNEGGFVSPSNLWNLNPSLRLELTRWLSLDLGVNFLWRYDAGDAVYGPPFNALAGAAPQGQSYLGTACNLALAWTPHPACEVDLGFTHHEAGPSLTAQGGKDVDYLQITVRLEF